MNNHILYISATLPTPGFGSSVIFYRHLKRLAGWKVSVVRFEQDTDKRHLLPESWRIITLGEPRCFTFLGRRLPGMATLNMMDFEKRCRQYKNDPPCAILNQLGLNSIFAYYLSKKWGIPLNIVIHDQWQAWTKAQVDRLFMTKEWAKTILNHASRIWAVSEEMAEYYSVKERAKVSVLYPIPEGSRGSFAEWEDEFAKHPVIAFAGSYHSSYAPLLRLAAESLLKIGGELFIMSKKMETAQKEIGDYKNIRYLRALPNAEALVYVRDNASAVFIPGSIDTRAAGWQLSFPSRLVEFAHTGLPTLITAMPDTALFNWAKKHNWQGLARSDDSVGLSEKINQLTRRNSWQAMALESRQAAQGEFNPGRIQEQFERELVLKG